MSLPRLVACLAILVSISVLAPASLAQFPPAGDMTSPPTPGVGHDYIHAPAETVNPANGSVSVRIPLRVPSGRELTIPLSIAYDSAGAFYYGLGQNGQGPGYETITNAVFAKGGWSYTFPILTFFEMDWLYFNGYKNFMCQQGANYVFQDPTGNRHNLGLAPIGTPIGAQCGGRGIDQGGEGPILATTQDGHLCCNPVTITDGNGTVYSFPGIEQSLPTSIVDRNGNTVSISSTTSSATVTDTVGRPAISVGSFGANPDSINVAGLTSPYQAYWTTASASFTINVVNFLDPLYPANCPTSLSASASVVSQVVLPNGQKYTLTYDPTYGMLNKITYPSGGYARYVWGLNPQAEYYSGVEYDSNGNTGAVYSCRLDFPAITDRYISFDGATEVLHQHFAYSTSWQTGSGNWTSKTTAVTTTDLVRNTSFSTVYSYTPIYDPCVPDRSPNGNDDHCIGNSNRMQMPVEQTIQYYGTNGSLLKTVTKSWFNNDPRTLGSEQTTLDNGQSSLAVYCYDLNEQVAEVDEYDYGTPSSALPSCANNVPSGTVPGPLLRKTTKTYAPFTGAHIVDLPSSVINCSGSGTDPACGSVGTRVTETDSYYDQTVLQSTSVVQHVAAPGGSARGNLTKMKKQCFNGSCGGGNPTATYSFYDTGQIYQQTDPMGNTTTYSYMDSYSSCGGNAPPSGASNGYLTQVTYPQTNGVNHIVSRCYNYTPGLMLSSTDENSQTTTFAYADSLDRLTQANYPDTGQTTYSYNDTPPNPTQTATKKLNSSQSLTAVTTMNGLGAAVQTQITPDPDCSSGDITKTSYDGSGRVYTVSNPYCTTSDPTYGITTTFYDALGRICLLVPPDGTLPSGGACPATQPANTIFSTYSGNCTTVTDQAGKSRKSCSDGLGRLTQVFEDPAGQNLETDYAYNTLDDLLTVNQKGGSTNSANWRTRTFTYDSLSQLTQATNPESGTISYSYDANGNLSSKTSPAPNQTGSSTVTLSYCYDALNRMTNKAYTAQSCPMTSPVATLTYDSASLDGHTMSFPIGRLVKTATSDGLTADWTSYDKMGRTATQWECTPLNCGSSSIQLGYIYDLAGAETSFIFNGGGYTISQGRDGVDRATGLTSSIVDANHPATLLTVDPSVGYWPAGALRKLQFGNGLYETAAYNKRLQPCRMNTNSTSTYTLTQCSDSLPSGNVLDFNYGFNLGSSDNGNVASWTATGQQAFSRSFTYDSLNRISTLNQSSGNATSCSSTFSLSWTIDPWGNRTDQTVTAGTCNAFHASANTQNQLIDTVHNAYTYDSAGNMTADGSHTYFYDAEDRLSQVDGSANYCTSHTGTPATACYVYDALGRRAEKNVSGHPTDYVYDAWGNVSNELNNVCAPVCIDTDYLYLDGQLVAEYKEGLTYFVHRDHLGSTRLVTNYPWVSQSQSIAQNLDYLPFGELISTDSGVSTHKFTGKERDSESGLDNFGARYNSSSMGRFMSPDPIYIEEQKMLDPQQLNLYSYVRNNPLNLTDSTGMLVDVNCQQVSAAQCSQTVTDFNNREGAQFQVSRDDKTGQLNVNGDVDPTKLSGSERALYDSITNKDATGTVTVVGNDSSFDFEKSTGKGQNSVDRSDLNALNSADKRLSGEIIAHAAIESYNSAKPGVSVDQAHELAAQSFGFKYGRFTPNFASQINTLFLNFRSTRLNEDFRATLTLKTPIPMVTFRKMQVEGGVLTLPRDVTKVSLIP